MYPAPPPRLQLDGRLPDTSSPIDSRDAARFEAAHQEEETTVILDRHGRLAEAESE
jgi:hypothetical protein